MREKKREENKKKEDTELPKLPNGNLKKQHYQENSKEDRQRAKPWMSISISLIAVAITAGHFICDHLYVNNQLSLMLSGFNLVSYIDSTGLMLERTMSVAISRVLLSGVRSP